MQVSRKFYKNLNTANPLLSNVFCADPYSFEYKGRLYIYGTNDNQQYKLVGDSGKNTYEHIKSLVCFSTDDLVNWTYHGVLDVQTLAPFILSAWSPAIVYKKEDDGLDHFYMYFSNNGCGVCVLTSTSPLGPWKSPLNKPLIEVGMAGIEELNNPFDPGVCIDDDGDAWLSFGAGTTKTGTDLYPGTARIVKLGKDMISLASDFVEVKAPYFFEASDLNYINGTYVYNYNNSWVERKEWPYDVEAPAECSMAYLTSKTPLDSASWVYQKHYFLNPGQQGLNYSNNHTHICKFQGTWYILYHTLTLQENTQTNGGFRSICMDKLDIDEEKVDIKLSRGTRQGLSPIKNLNAFEKVQATCSFTSADIEYENEIMGSGQIAVKAKESGAWIMIKNVDFGNGAKEIQMELKGSGSLNFRIDKISSKSLAVLEINEKPSLENINTYETSSARVESPISGIHDVFLIFSDKDLCLKNWNLK